jgi:hypothetical protein
MIASSGFELARRCTDLGDLDVPDVGNMQAVPQGAVQPGKDQLERGAGRQARQDPIDVIADEGRGVREDISGDGIERRLGVLWRQSRDYREAILFR